MSQEVVRLEGLPEFNRAIQKLIRSMDPDKVEPILKKGATTIAKAVLAKTPEGPTKNLKKSVKVKKLSRRGNQPAPYIAAIDRKRAPHAHLVIEGTKGIRVAKKGKYKGKKFGRMPANPFFQTALKEKESEVVSQVSADLQKLVGEVVK